MLDRTLFEKPRKASFAQGVTRFLRQFTILINIIRRAQEAEKDVQNLQADGDPHAACHMIAAHEERLRKLSGARVAVIVSDTFGRPWRLGLTNVAIGAAGLAVLEDLRGTRDASGRTLQGTILALADELAAAAGLVMKKAAQIPAVVIRGVNFARARGSARQLIRPASQDMFR